MNPFDSNSVCSSKYLSPIYIDMKDNSEIYQCSNCDYLKFNYVDTFINKTNITYENSTGLYYLNINTPNNSILYKNEVYNLLYITFNVPGTHTIKVPKKQLGSGSTNSNWSLSSGQLAILDESNYETINYALEINFVHSNDVNKKMVVLSSECVTDRSLIDKNTRVSIETLWNSVENPNNLQNYINAYACEKNGPTEEFTKVSAAGGPNNLRSYCGQLNNVENQDVLDPTNINSFRP